MPSVEPRVTSVDLVRASNRTALLRIDVAGLADVPAHVALVVEKSNEPEQRLSPLPTPSHDGSRFSFALPPALRLAKLTLVLDTVELPVAAPPERSRQDAVASVALRDARARMAELERALEERGAAAAASVDDDALRERLEQQLAEHRLLRAQLARELESARDRTREIEEELQRVQFERERLVEELESERSGSVSEREQLSERLEQARTRVEYLERRVVEVQAQAARPDGA